MKTCECGGTLLRHGIACWHKGIRGEQAQGMRYRCKSCGKCITVRGGKVIQPNAPREMIRDWRFA